MGVELLYNSVKIGIRSWGPEKLLIRCGRESPAEGALGAPDELEIGWSKRQDVVGKATPGRWSHRGPRLSWGPEKLLIRCSKESHHPGDLRLSSPGERERHNVDGHKSGGQYIAVLFGLQLPLTIKPGITSSNPYNKVRGTYFSKEIFARPLSLCRCDSFSIYMYSWSI